MNLIGSIVKFAIVGAAATALIVTSGFLVVLMIREVPVLRWAMIGGAGLGATLALGCWFEQRKRG